MSDERTTIVETSPAYSGALLGAIAVAVLAALGGLIWSYTLSSRIARQETALSEANQQSAKLDAQLRETNARLRVATDELEKSVGMTQNPPPRYFGRTDRGASLQ
jgi:type II secretory pathway component PulM